MGWLGLQLKHQWKCNEMENTFQNIPPGGLLHAVGITDLLSNLGLGWGLDPLPEYECSSNNELE